MTNACDYLRLDRDKGQSRPIARLQRLFTPPFFFCSILTRQYVCMCMVDGHGLHSSKNWVSGLKTQSPVFILPTGV